MNRREDAAQYMVAICLGPLIRGRASDVVIAGINPLQASPEDVNRDPQSVYM